MIQIALASVLLSTLLSNSALAQDGKPTVVLVHGAFADASSWNGVSELLMKDGYRVVAAANPLRGVSSDAEAVGGLVSTIEGPVVLVGHSYGGSVISAAAADKPNVKSLVFVAAFAPDMGEAAGDLAGKFPGGTLGAALSPPVRLSAGSKDLYIDQAKFHDQFANDVPEADARLMAVNQRPITEAALTEASGPPAWKTIPSWFIYGEGDRNIPAKALAFMAERAGSRGTVVLKGASHSIMVSQPRAVAELIERAAE